tara:strand:+ start:4844 stop:8008 length:3165 start_codon:yes stop_codon:yes gene_type:complete
MSKGKKGGSKSAATGTRLAKELLQGILVPDERVTLENIHSGSSYTEQGPRPGVPVPDNAANTLRPIITSSQVADVRAGIVRAGGVGAAEIAYKLDSEGAGSWRGYSYPSAAVYSDMWSEDEVTSDGIAFFDCTTDPNTQDVLAVYSNSIASLRFVRWKARTWEPLATVQITTGATVGKFEQRSAAIQVQPSGRIVAWAGALSFFSDDGGQTWSSYAEGGYPISSFAHLNKAQKRVVRVGGDYLSIWRRDTFGGNDLAFQYGSTDQGQTWRPVGGVFSFAIDFDAAEMHDGSAYIAYIDASNDLKAVRVSGAFESVADALSSAQTLNSVLTWNAVAIAADPNGDLYVFARSDFTIFGFQYIDGAWVQMTTGGSNFGASENAPTFIAGTSTNGGVMLISDANPSEQTVADNKQLRGTLYGGYSTLVANHAGEQIQAPGFANAQAIHYEPIAVPDVAGAWATSGPVVGSATITAEGLSINAQNLLYERKLTPSATGSGISCQWSVKVNSSHPSAPMSPGVRLLANQGLTAYVVEIFYRAAQVEIFDVIGSVTIATIPVNTAQDRIYSCSINQSGAVVFGHRQKGDTVWSITTGTATPAPSPPPLSVESLVMFGHAAPGTISSVWQWMQARAVKDFAGPFYWVHGQADLVGRVLNGIPTPLPVIGDDVSQVAFIHAEGGDAPDQSAYTIDAAHDYPIEATLPQVSPSPSIGWRSINTAEQSIVWDFGSANTDRSYMGKAIGLYLDGCNFRSCELEASLNGTTWTTIQSIDMASGMNAAIPYTLAGDVMTFGPGQAERYLFGEMLRGSHVIISAGKSTVSRKIAANLSGAISTGTTTSRPALRLEALDGTEAASGLCVIVSKRALSVAYTPLLATFRYWRVRIPAGQDVCGIGPDPETGYRIGSLVLGEWLAYGGGTGIGWTEAAAPNYAETVSRRGTRYRKSYGPPARRWSLVWDEADRFLEDTTPDFVSPGILDQPLAARAEIYEQLRAIAIRTGALSVPVVASRYVPSATGTTVWPSTMLYGHISGEVELQQVTGDNDFTGQQVIRAGNIQIDEVI